MATKADQLQLVQSWFSYHPPSGDQAQRMNKLRSLCRDLALQFVELSPVCEDQTVALRMLRETNMMMNATLACNERASTEPEGSPREHKD